MSPILSPVRLPHSHIDPNGCTLPLESLQLAIVVPPRNDAVIRSYDHKRRASHGSKMVANNQRHVQFDLTCKPIPFRYCNDDGNYHVWLLGRGTSAAV